MVHRKIPTYYWCLYFRLFSLSRDNGRSQDFSSYTLYDGHGVDKPSCEPRHLPLNSYKEIVPLLFIEPGMNGPSSVGVVEETRLLSSPLSQTTSETPTITVPKTSCPRKPYVKITKTKLVTSFEYHYSLSSRIVCYDQRF